MFEWKDAYLVNVNEIDRQHRKLVQWINELDTAMGQGKGKDVLAKVLNGLIQYTATHFAYEEKLLAAQGYPDLVKHKAEHEALTKQVLNIQAQFLSNRLGLTIPTMEFLTSWLANHIVGTDKQYGPFLNSRGIR